MSATILQFPRKPTPPSPPQSLIETALDLLARPLDKNALDRWLDDLDAWEARSA